MGGGEVCSVSTDVTLVGAADGEGAQGGHIGDEQTAPGGAGEEVPGGNSERGDAAAALALVLLDGDGLEALGAGRELAAVEPGADLLAHHRVLVHAHACNAHVVLAVPAVTLCACVLVEQRDGTGVDVREDVGVSVRGRVGGEQRDARRGVQSLGAADAGSAHTVRVEPVPTGPHLVPTMYSSRYFIYT